MPGPGDRTPGQPGIGQTGRPGQQQPDLYPGTQRPIFISGKVMMDDGTPPPESVVIERVCNAARRPEGYTDTKGRFSFQLGQSQGMISDASISSADTDAFGSTATGGRPLSGVAGGRQLTERDLMGCELRAVLPGFRSDTVNLAGRRVMDNPDVGTIILHRLGNVEGTTVSFTSLQAPKDAKKAYDKAREALRKNKVADAQKELEKAVAAYPKYASAWYELGNVRQQQKDADGARKAYQEALAADAKYVSPYLQLALMAAQERKWQEVAETSDRVLRLNPLEFPQAYFFSAVANYNLGKMDLAEKNAREAQKLDVDHRYPKASHLLGVILAEKRDYEGALASMRAYLQFAPAAQDAEAVKKTIGELERVTGASAAAAPKPQ